jgi:hypothetical protein
MREIIAKLTSGRFILTVICGLTFAYLACKKILPNEATMGVIILVFEAYFHRSDRTNEKGEVK